MQVHCLKKRAITAPTTALQDQLKTAAMDHMCLLSKPLLCMTISFLGEQDHFAMAAVCKTIAFVARNDPTSWSFDFRIFRLMYGTRGAICDLNKAERMLGTDEHQKRARSIALSGMLDMERAQWTNDVVSGGRELYKRAIRKWQRVEHEDFWAKFCLARLTQGGRMLAGPDLGEWKEVTLAEAKAASKTIISAARVFNTQIMEHDDSVAKYWLGDIEAHVNDNEHVGREGWTNASGNDMAAAAYMLRLTSLLDSSVLFERHKHQRHPRLVLSHCNTRQRWDSYSNDWENAAQQGVVIATLKHDHETIAEFQERRSKEIREIQKESEDRQRREQGFIVIPAETSLFNSIPMVWES